MVRETFAEVARRILIEEKRRSLRDVAQDINMEYATLHSRVSGRTPFRPEEINALLTAVPDVRLVDALLQETGFIGVEQLQVMEWGNSAQAIGTALRTAQELLQVIAAIHSTAGTRLNSVDRCRIEAHIHEAERSLARLRLAIPHLSAAYAYASA